MKKATLIAVLFSMLTISTQAQWFDFSENLERGTVGFDCGALGSRSVVGLSDGSTTFTGLGMGLSVSLFGLYADFLYSTPDHMYDSEIVMVNWDDQDAFVLNFGYQIPIYENYVFFTPLVGWSRVSTGYTQGNSISIDTESHTIHHKYHSTWHRNDFNYGCLVTVCPIKWLDINLGFTNHAAYGGVAFNFGGVEK